MRFSLRWHLRMTPPVSLVLLFLTAMAWMGRALPTYAQPNEPAERRYTVALLGIPLADALDRLIEETQLSLAYKSDWIHGKTTFCKAVRVPEEALLRCVLQDTGLDFARLSSGTYVLIPDLHAPPRYGSLTGQVVDAETGTPLADANVFVTGEALGAATNRHGRFAFAALRPGPHRLVVTHVAYQDRADSVWVTPETNERVAILMQPSILLSSPVVVSGFEARLPSDALGAAQRTAGEGPEPAGLGTPDVVQDLKAVVGVRLGDALSDVHVQGGASNEQQFLLDGIPVFVPVSNGGFVGSFSPFATGQVTVRKAGFGASHGSGLSGVIEVEHRVGEDASLTVQIDPLSANARWTGTVGTPEQMEASWMVAARGSLWELYRPSRLETLFESWATPDRFLLQALQAPEARPVRTEPAAPAPAPLDVGFLDLHAAARVRFGGLRTLNLSFYDGRSVFGTDAESPDAAAGDGDAEDAYQWANRAGRISYEWVQSRRLFAAASAWTSSYFLTHPTSPTLAPGPPPDEFNELIEVGGRLEGDLALDARHTLSGALEAAQTDSDFSLSLDPFGASPTEEEGVRPVKWRFGAFLEDRLALSRQATLILGTRVTYLPARKTIYAEPRLALQYDRKAGSGGSWAVRTAAGLYRQYLHSFDVANYNVTSLLPRVRFWLPVGRAQRLPEAYHATAAVRYRTGPVWAFGIESYYKHQPHLLVLDYGGRAANPSGSLFTDAEGYAYGLALTTRREGTRVQFNGQYEYAVARRRIPNRFGGATVPVPWDAPHRLYLALDVLVHPSLTATVRWQGLYGRRWGFRLAYYDFLEPDPRARLFPPFDLSDPAAHRLPAFSQWDVGLAYTRTVAGVNLQARVAVMNLLGRRNVTDWSLRYEERTARYVHHPRHAVPFLPSFSLRLSY